MIRLVIAFLVVCAMSARAAEPGGKFVDLGVQLTSMTLQGTTFTKDPAGRDLICAVLRGDPAKLLVFDVATGELLHRLPLEGSHGAWNATTASDGSVYVGTDDNGHLYRWIPGQKTVDDLGQVGPEQTFVWDLTAGADGEVFVGTYPGCQVIRYHPRDGFSDVGRGPVAPGENYARGITRDPVTGKIYVGVGAHPRLIELDPATGDKTDILPKEYADRKFVYSVRFAAGRLFALVTDGSAECLVIEPATRKVEVVLPNVTPQLVVSQTSPHDDNRVYLKSQNGLAAYDLKSHTLEPTSLAQAGGINAMTWTPDGALAMLTQPGRLIHYDPKNAKASSNLALKPPREPTPIQSICRGPDGKIYCGGYLVGGLSAFDPATGKHEQLGSISQAEGMGVLGSKLYLGLYPRARLYAFDPTKPWDGKSNPEKLEELDRFDQDRPFAVLGVEKLNQVFLGSVPDYGTLGGALSVWDVGSRKLDVYRNVVQDQGVTALVWADGVIVGGTTRSGGLGIEPKAKEAKLFLWDPASRQKIFETAPVPGTWLISGLLVGQDKKVSAVADETLFAFDPAQRQVVFSRPLFKVDEKTRHARWRDAFLLEHPDGRIYGTMGGRLFRYDAKNDELIVLREKEAVLLAMDEVGRLYFRDRTHLWQFTPP